MNDAPDADAILAPTLRHIEPGDAVPPCLRCGQPAVQEVTVGRTTKTRHYFCFAHAVVVAEV